MAKIKIKNEGIIIELPDNEHLLHYLDGESGVPFGCRQGKCGACSCVVLSGEENLNSKSRLEEETLAKAGAPTSKRNRLACQLRVNQNEVEIEY